MSFPSSGSVAAYLKPHENFNRTNFVRRDFRAKIQVNFNNMDNGARMTAGGERPSNLGERLPFAASRVFKEHEQYSQRKKRDFVHVLLKRNKTFVTVTDVSGNKKTGLPLVVWRTGKGNLVSLGMLLKQLRNMLGDLLER